MIEFSSFLFFLDVFGTFVFAISGAIAGVKKNMDAFGMLILAIVTASGGGVLRSILIGDTPVGLLKNPWYITMSLVATILVFLFRKHFLKHTKQLLFFDALGLGVFVSIGITVALEHHLSFWASILLGVITASFGGVVRDTLCAQVPLIFQKDLYATVCFIGGVVYMLLTLIYLPKEMVMTLCFLVVFLLRLLAMNYNWRLPK